MSVSGNNINTEPLIDSNGVVCKQKRKYTKRATKCVKDNKQECPPTNSINQNLVQPKKRGRKRGRKKKSKN